MEHNFGPSAGVWRPREGKIGAPAGSRRKISAYTVRILRVQRIYIALYGLWCFRVTVDWYRVSLDCFRVVLERFRVLLATFIAHLACFGALLERF